MTYDESIKLIKQVKQEVTATGAIHEKIALAIQTIEDEISILKEQLNEAKNGGHKDKTN